MSVDILTKMISIIVLNIVLSGDNAVVIALATRKLEPKQCKKAIIVGTGGAVVLRIILMLVAIYLLQIPFVKIVGSLLLLYIAFDLLKSNNSDDEAEIAGNSSFAAAVRTIIVADLVMSLDNVLAIAGVADGHFFLAAFGVVISIPIVVFASQLILKLMNRFPILIWIGALLIAYTSGEMIIEDKEADHFLNLINTGLSHSHIIPIIFCLFLIIIYIIFTKVKGYRKLSISSDK
jgi:YjbE family integral membrane protein